MRGSEDVAEYEALVAQRRQWQHASVALLVGVGAWRLLYAAIVPLDLAPDEAYYWDWSRELDWGYYSKPPLVAWLIALSTRLLGSTPFTVRLPAVVAGIGCLWALHALARRMGGPRVGFGAAALFAASPGAAVGGFVMTIDAPLLLFWALSLLFVQRAVNETSGRVRWWLATGLAVGCGLLSKQIMAIFPLLTIVFLLASREQRGHLRTPGPYLVLLVPALAAVPMLLWNARHGWVTLHHTASHFSRHVDGFLPALTSLATFVGSQLLVLSPLAPALFVAVGVASAKQWRQIGSGARLLWTFSLPPLLAFAILSVRQNVNANWPAVCYLSAAVLLSLWARGALPVTLETQRVRRLFAPAVAIGAAFAVVTYAVPFLVVPLGVAGTARDPTARLRGWRSLGVEVGRVLGSLPDRERTLLVADSRQLVSELAFYTPGQPRAFALPHHGERSASQYDLWGWPGDRTGSNALIVMGAGREPPDALRRAFRSLVPLGPLILARADGEQHRYSLFRGIGLTAGADSFDGVR